DRRAPSVVPALPASTERLAGGVRACVGTALDHLGAPGCAGPCVGRGPGLGPVHTTQAAGRDGTGEDAETAPITGRVPRGPRLHGQGLRASWRLTRAQPGLWRLWAPRRRD